MDKFGIFNVLSSLLNFVGTDKSAPAAQGGTNDNPPERMSDDGKSAEARAKTAPLQAAMLFTMKNHDEFVKRVTGGKNGN